MFQMKMRNGGHSWLKGLVAASALLTSLHGFADDKVRFQLDWLPGGDKAPIYVGMQKGFFKDAGIDVSVAVGKGSTDAITRLASGNADLGLCDVVSLLMARSEDNSVPVSAIYSVFSQAPHTFFVTEKSGINSVADVAGKRVATSPFTSSNVFFPLLLKVNNVDESSVKLQKVDAGALNPMLITGNTDVVISWITDTVTYSNQAKNAGVKLKVLPWYDAGLEFYSTSVIGNDAFMQSHPDLTKRFVKAYEQAIDYTWKHPDESGEIVHDMVPEVDAKTAADTVRVIRKLVYNKVSEKDGLGAFTPERLATTWKWIAKSQKVPVDSFDPETAIDRSYMPAE